MIRHTHFPVIDSFELIVSGAALKFTPIPNFFGRIFYWRSRMLHRE